MHNKALQTKDSPNICTKPSHPEEDITNFYTDVDETLGKPNHYTVVMGYFNAQIGKRTNPMVTATDKLN